jgi:hypothetical protein
MNLGRWSLRDDQLPKYAQRCHGNEGSPGRAGSNVFGYCG